MSEDGRGRTATELIADSFVDAELASLLWLLMDGGVPLVVTTNKGTPVAEELRSALAALVGSGRTNADGVLPGGTVYGSSLEDLLRLSGAAGLDEVPDEARELGVVAVLGQPMRRSRYAWCERTTSDRRTRCRRSPPATPAGASQRAERSHVQARPLLLGDHR